MRFLKRKTKKKEDNFTKTTPEQDPVIEVSPKAVQQLYRGSRQLYSENIEENLQTLFRRLPDPNLSTEEFIVGSRSKTRVVMAFLKDVANPEIVNEIKDRIGKIKAEIIPDSSYIERSIQDSIWSPFPQVELITKADVTLTALSQGRVALFVDGCPEVIIAPATFFDILDTPEDAYRRWFVASGFFRLVRLFCFLVAILFPGFYIALTSFNPELIPSALAINIAAAKEGTPFPIYIETFFLMGMAELIRIIMLRMPNTTGQSIAIFAGVTLILTGFFSNTISGPVIIIVGISIAASFAIPGFDLRSSIRIIQFFIMIISTLFGLYGLAISAFYILIHLSTLKFHLSTLKSFGIPYMTPLGPRK